SSRTAFNLGAGTERYYSFAAERGLLDYVFIGGPAIPDVVSRYTELTGRPYMPPAWSLGYQQSRWSYYPDTEVLDLARTFRRRRIPADVIYLDIHYMDGYRVFTWNPRRFPHPEAMLDTLQHLGFKVVTIIDPGVKADSSYAMAREGLQHGYFARFPDGPVYVGSVWPGRSYFPDFGQAAVRTWWGNHDAAFMRQGVAGFWNDMNEPSAWGGTVPPEVVMHDDGRTATMRTMHDLYGFLMAQATYEGMRRAQPDRRPFIVTRAGFSGIQRYAAVWTGDNIASWEHLQLAVRMLVGMGLSGIPFVGSDVGGFVGSPSPELYGRWVELGVFSPFFRTHTTINSLPQDPWSFGEYVEDINRRSIRLRYALLPYLYTLMWQAHETGAPVMRPLFWGHQDDTAAYDPAHQEEFLAGDHLLVAPVVHEGRTLKRVYLPAGSRWLDLATDSVYQGGHEVVVDAPLDRLPMFLEAGGILPRRPPEQYVGQQPMDTLYLDAFPGDSAGSFRLYEDDGESYAFEKGGYRVTRFEVARDGAGLRLGRVVEHDGYRPHARTLVARLHDVAAKPRSVDVWGGAAGRLGETTTGAGWAYDAARHVLMVRIQSAGDRQEIVVR
ncbi:MAG TPA: TIM-barrel domain-containing protein, partial [Longimicrobiales bacterium]|nr:TIM-barrel domain-containing protein [Longimicrobiales bacterium]